MIVANELRVGNWINIPECAINTKVKTIDTQRFAVERDNIDLSPGENVFFYKSANPISLTPEILEKCGFEANKYNDEFKYGLLLLDCEYTDKGEFNVVFNDCKLPLALKYLHQLQNLYYALTGEELKFND